MLWLLDTDHVSFLQRTGDRGDVIRARLKTLSPDDYGTSIVTYEEQVKGRLEKTHKANTPRAQVEAYTSLHTTLRYYLLTAVWDYTPRAATIFWDLKSQKINIGTQDLKIASIALANDATLLTANTKDFARVPLLQFENWTATDE